MIVDSIKRKLVAMNNRSIALDREGKKKMILNKIDYHNNLKSMGQNGEILLLDNDDVKASLRSVRWMISKDEKEKGILGKMQILGNNLHIVEGLTRMAELARKGENLSIWIDYV